MPPPSTSSCTSPATKIKCIWDWIDCIDNQDRQDDSQDLSDELKFSMVEGEEDWLVPVAGEISAAKGEITVPGTNAEGELWEACMVEEQEESFNLELREYDGSAHEALGDYTIFVRFENGKPDIYKLEKSGESVVPDVHITADTRILRFEHGYDYLVQVRVLPA